MHNPKEVAIAESMIGAHQKPPAHGHVGCGFDEIRAGLALIGFEVTLKSIGPTPSRDLILIRKGGVDLMLSGPER